MKAIEVQVRRDDFARGVKYARQQRGRFDGARKVWILPDTETVRAMMRAPRAYGWVIAAAPIMNPDDPPINDGDGQIVHD